MPIASCKDVLTFVAHFLPSITTKKQNMEKRIFGIILTVMGIIGLIMAAVRFADGVGNDAQIRSVAVYGILGAVFFFAGIGLVRSTREIKKKDEELI
jgi:uncharacterized membrane protein